MRRLILILAFLAAACGSKSKPTTDPGDTTEGGGDDTGEEAGASLAEVAPELDELNTEIGSIRDLPVEERDVEVCEATKSLGRMVEDLEGATPAGVDAGAWESAIEQMSSSLGDVKGACPDKVDELDAAFTQLLDALDGLVETTQRDDGPGRLMRALPPVELWWIHSAPLRVTTVQRIAAPPARVFAELAGDQTWPEFFPLMRSMSWASDARGVGCEREVDILGFGRFRERFLAWDGDSFAFTMIGTTSPLMRAMGEHGQLHADGDGTRISWTVGAEPTRVGKALLPAVMPVTRKLFAEAFRRLARRVEA